jgi:hypothetical protein
MRCAEAAGQLQDALAGELAHQAEAGAICLDAVEYDRQREGSRKGAVKVA